LEFLASEDKKFTRGLRGGEGVQMKCRGLEKGGSVKRREMGVRRIGSGLNYKGGKLKSSSGKAPELKTRTINSQRGVHNPESNRHKLLGKKEWE